MPSGNVAAPGTAGRATAWLGALAALLVLLQTFGCATAEARPPSEPWIQCRDLLEGFVLRPLDLRSETRLGAAGERSAVRFDWRWDPSERDGDGGYLVCWFLPLAQSGGLWQLDTLHSDLFGRLDRYDIQQLIKLIRQRSFGLTSESEAPLVELDPLEVAWRHAVQQGINALSLGALYGLIAVGFTLAFAVSGVFNLALGTLFTLGAFQAFLAWLLGEAWFGAGWLLAIPTMLVMALIGGAAAGAAMQGLVFSRATDRHAAVVASAGLLIALQEALRLLQGPKTRWLPYRDGNSWRLLDDPAFPLVVSRGHLVVLLTTLALVALLAWYLRRTAAGRALRAVADDPGAASLLGIDVRRCVSQAFLLAGALAAVAGGFAFLHYGSVDPTIGLVTGFKALAAAILGGIGSVFGALLGGLLIAFVEAAAAGLGLSAWKELLVFAVLIGVLVLRPAGLLGRHPEGASVTRPPAFR